MQKWIILMVTAIIIGCSDKNYRSGRDTVKAFGDGRFQVLRIRGKRNILYDLQQQRTIVYDVEDWSVVSNYVFSFDREKQVFVVLDLKSGRFKQYKDANLAPSEIRSALQKVEPKFPRRSCDRKLQGMN